MKKLDKKRYFLIGTETYKQDILCCFNMTNAEAFKIYKKLNKAATKEDEEYILNDEEGETIEGTLYPLSRGYLITLKWYKDSFRQNVCHALHELTHATHYILRKVRVPLEENTEEAYTYLLEELFKKFLFKLY